MKSLDADKKVSKTTNSTSEAAPEKEEVIDFSKVKVEPLFEEFVDFDTFSIVFILLSANFCFICNHR